MSSNSDEPKKRLPVPKGEDPATGEFWQNRCFECSKIGHRANTTQCPVELLRRENKGKARKISLINEENKMLREEFKESKFKLAEYEGIDATWNDKST
ncbi:hypothetical protein N7488_008852 [Penicillium malachiteum]|nr:hypothetical protein N7488_008852 [Penicillium malachiteum]